MKIWQRILLTTVIIAMTVMLFEFVVITRNFNQNIQNEVQNSLTLHKDLYKDIESEIKQLLTQQEIHNSADNDNIDMSSIYNDSVNQVSKGMTYSEYGIQMITDTGLEVTNFHFYAMGKQNIQLDSNYEAKYVITMFQGKRHMIVKSKKKVRDIEVTVVTQYDMTEIYDSYTAQVNRMKKTGLILLLEAALILFMVVFYLLLPLRRVQKGIREITDGNYGKQLKYSGRTEISELTMDINQMSSTIATNIGEMEEMAENRRIFIGNMSHEMKTPLTGILGFADILTIKQDITQEQKIEYSEHIYREALRLRTMSGKLMEMVQLQENKVNAEMINLKEFLEDVVDTESVILKKDNITLYTELCEATIFADPDLLKSLIFNIIDNACKATEVGGEIKLLTAKNKGKVEIQVVDYGIGIPKDEIKKITEAFYMVDKSRARKSGGAGLGLALCKKIVELSKGTMLIESEEGKGCTVTISLPIVENIHSN